jgi:hypothetical protein
VTGAGKMTPAVKFRITFRMTRVADFNVSFSKHQMWVFQQNQGEIYFFPLAPKSYLVNSDGVPTTQYCSSAK